jgi:hypothetical protein
MLGKVTVNTGAIGPGTFPEPEGVALFIGEVTAGDGVAAPIGLNTDLVALFTSGELVDTIEHARANGGPRWKGYAIGHTNLETWEDVIDAGLAAVTPEMIVVCKPVTAAAELTALQARAVTELNLARRLFFLAAFRGIGAEDWATYLAAAQAVTTGVDAQRVQVVPLLYGSELGAFAGRLALHAFETKINRSPMRVRSGSVLNPGAKPADSGAVPLDIATLEALDTARFSVFQWYEGKEGIYFANANTLESAGGDFPVAEWLRVTDKGARRVRLEAISAIADDTVRNTPAGNAAFATRLASPLRAMAIAGELEPLAADAVTVAWIDASTVQVYMTVRARNAPKDITVSIQLDTATA